jgi:hypothetical protein
MEPTGGKRSNTPHAANQIEQPLALLAQEKVVVMTSGAFVMWRNTRDFDGPDLPVRNKLPDGTVNGSDAQGRNFALSFFTDLRRGQGALRAFEYLA